MRRTQLLIFSWVLYILTLGLVAFWPTPVDKGLAGPLQEAINLFNQYFGVSWLSYGFVEFAANIALFVPAGILIRLTAHTSNLFIQISVILSAILAIELLQKLLLEQRFASPFDLLANAVGLLVGLLLMNRKD